MRNLLLLLTLLMAFGLAQADSSSDKHGVAPSIEASAAIDNQTNCASPEGISSSDSLLADSKKCCKVCKKGKACGDSCIAKSKTCTKGPGCACNGY
ncbi:hypothetical protein DFP83_11315 [Idiomarina fontislapidosi]|uniref:hypothetical protein n=1 Tax=Idiomarina fontislapidosi TaxID=263723 RepID=UPI000D9A7DDD|nr:hypothetical protein [Idiomarina fontislapidosi]PYE30817.1 hypothetical protein DFP83_11315 [Idiomarina fontislapidosi]